MYEVKLQASFCVDDEEELFHIINEMFEESYSYDTQDMFSFFCSVARNNEDFMRIVQEFLVEKFSENNQNLKLESIKIDYV